MGMFSEEYEAYISDMLEFIIFDIRRKVDEEMRVWKRSDSTVDALTIL